MRYTLLIIAALMTAPLFGFAPTDPRPVDDGMKRMEEILHGLEQGMAALEVLEQRELLGEMGKLADRVRERMAHTRREMESREREENPERAMAIRHLEIMRTAMPALREAGRRDVAELLEHAIHARELTLEGKNGPDAMEIRRSAPDRGQVMEILMLSADLWDGFGHETKAANLRELANHYREGIERRERPGAEREVERREVERTQVEERRRAAQGQREAERAVRAEERRARGAERRGAGTEEMTARIDRLERMVEELAQAVRSLHERERARDRD